MSTPENKTEEIVTTENEVTGPADAVKESRMTVNMTKEALYDFLLFHAYSKFSGFLVNVLGLAIVFMGIFSYTTGRVNGVGQHFILLRQHCSSAVHRSSLRCGQKNRLL